MRASVLNRLTYTLCFFRASLLLTRALPLLLPLPMYYRCITRASCILSPSLWCVCVCVCVCTLYHRTRAGKSEDAFENYSNRRWDRSSCQRILWNRMGYTRPFSNREVFSFFRFSFSVSVRELWHSFTVEWNTTERERERNKKYKLPFFHSFLFWGEWILLS